MIPTEGRKKQKENWRRAKNELVLKIAQGAILRREYCSEAGTIRKMSVIAVTED